MEDGNIDASDVEIDVKGGRVTLEGSVDNRMAKYQIEDLIEQFGVSDVQNNLRVSRRDEGSSSWDRVSGSTGDRVSGSSRSSGGSSQSGTAGGSTNYSTTSSGGGGSTTGSGGAATGSSSGGNTQGSGGSKGPSKSGQ
jgi:hypothetical protein